MTNGTFQLDMRKLRYFVTAAEEGSLRGAAERLYISQPPLSRQIRSLELDLGVTLFIRTTRGISLTADGARVLAAVKPLFDAYDHACEALRDIAETGEKTPRIGFSTAFEQGVFLPLEKKLRTALPRPPAISRLPSPKLVRDVAAGSLDAAFVAMPVATKGLAWALIGYEEPFVLALPETWLEAQKETLFLSALNGKRLFWFPRDANPAYYDFARAVFAQAEFAPVFLEEPAEHDVLLSRIASGEAAGLFTSSLAVITRKGVVYRRFRESSMLTVKLGVVAPQDSASGGFLLFDALVAAAGDCMRR